jgi:leucine-zipper-like transcriptional regulator 1
MHSADVLDSLIYIFRGGDGKDYLNDLHSIDTESKEWKLIETKGKTPDPRANHCSSLINR